MPICMCLLSIICTYTHVFAHICITQIHSGNELRKNSFIRENFIYDSRSASIYDSREALLCMTVKKHSYIRSMYYNRSIWEA